MKRSFVSDLQQLGLSSAEAQIYTTLLNNGSLGAAAIASLTGLQRCNVYPVLWSLADKGLVAGGAGYGSTFAAVPPAKALPSLITRERESLSQHEQLAEELAELMSPLVPSEETAPKDLIEVLRNPQVVADRFQQLQLEARRQIDVFTKPPFFHRTGNPAQKNALRRGVHARSLYEKAALEDPAVKPYIATWIGTGEEARVYDGELPHKLVIFDSQVVLMPLITPGEQTRTLVIRHAQLAQSLSLAFQFLWERSKPIAPKHGKKVGGGKAFHLNGNKQIKGSRGQKRPNNKQQAISAGRGSG
jgi:HTH-type transcriptional regulator, sugar sensing transcriptional regulator